MKVIIKQMCRLVLLPEKMIAPRNGKRARRFLRRHARRAAERGSVSAVGPTLAQCVARARRRAAARAMRSGSARARRRATARARAVGSRSLRDSHHITETKVAQIRKSQGTSIHQTPRTYILEAREQERDEKGAARDKQRKQRCQCHVIVDFILKT
jgi:hypothetical protein